MPSTAVNHFVYTAPSAIEGEVPDVVAIAKKQIEDLAAVVAELTKDTFLQLQSAGLGDDVEDAVKAWLDSEDGRKADELVWAARVFVEAAKQLQ